jgi:hypothetical protein
MAFKQKALALTATNQDVLVCGVGLSDVVHSLTFGNDTGTARVVTLSLYDQAAGATLPLGKVAVAANSAARWADKINLTPGDKLIAKADAADAVTLYAGYLEQGGAAPVATAFNPREDWSALATYGVNDIVYRATASPTTTGAYLSKVDNNTGNDPATSPAQWLQLTQQGADGVTQDISGKLDKTGGVATGLKETHVAVTNEIDLNAGNYFTKTVSGAWNPTLANVPAVGVACSFILDLTNGGSAAITWWANVKWKNGTAPTLTAAGRDVLGFFTHDGGATWTGLLLGLDIR